MDLSKIDQWFQLPPQMNDFVLDQVRKGLFASKTDYWKYLIRELMLGNEVRAFNQDDIPKLK